LGKKNRTSPSPKILVLFSAIVKSVLGDSSMKRARGKSKRGAGDVATAIIQANSLESDANGIREMETDDMAQSNTSNEISNSGDKTGKELARSVVQSEELQPAASVKEDARGKTIIHHDVVAKIVGTAIREVSGVHSLVPYHAGQAAGRLASKIIGNKMRELGVNVEVGRVEVAVDARIVTHYGESIVDIADAVRDIVTRRVEEIAGLRVVEVNLEIVDVHFPEEASSEITARVQ
jgi:uncharacterized alkaline shock family protein YloU